jgi:hypothetical protein
MQTLEQRMERLERSCRRWRLAFVGLAAAAAVGAVARPVVQDAQFAHLTVQKLTIRSQPDGAFLSAECGAEKAALTLAAPKSSTLVTLVADKDSANVAVSRGSNVGLGSASLGADGQSGFVNIRTADGKGKEIEPE